MMKTKSNKKTVLILLCLIVLIAFIPLFALRGVEFGGSDDAGSQMVEEITGTEYTPWFTPVLERAIHGELPGEVESLFFCLQTGIGVGIIAFIMGRLVERKKQEELRAKEIEAIRSEKAGETTNSAN